MIELKKTYPNGTERIFTVIEATAAGEDTAIVKTVEDGVIVVSAVDHPDLWGQLAGSGVDIAPEPKLVPMPTIPTVEEKMDADLRARQKQKLQVGQARAALADGDIASAIAALAEAIEPTSEQNALDAKAVAAMASDTKIEIEGGPI
jgi:hypothetical protein